jgi:hypothetical protein
VFLKGDREWGDFHEAHGAQHFLLNIYKILSPPQKKSKSQVKICNICEKRDNQNLMWDTVGLLCGEMAARCEVMWVFPYHPPV